jgi:RNA polymerase sigma-70 factor (ECF subfamily)
VTKHPGRRQLALRPVSAVPTTRLAAPAQPFRELYRAHHEFVWRCARRLGVDAAAVDDVVQDVFLAAYRQADVFDGRGPFKAWLFGITLNVVRMHRRGEFRHRRRVEDVAHVVPALVDTSDRHSAIDLLDRLLATLDEDQRTVIILVELEDMSPRDVAAGLGRSVNTVYSRLRLARAHLQRAVQRHRARQARSA